MEVDVVHATGRNAGEPRRVEVLDVGAPMVQQVQQAELEAQSRHRCAKTRIDRGRPRGADTVVLDQGVGAEASHADRPGESA